MHIYSATCTYIRVSITLKTEVRQVNQKLNLKRGNIAMHKRKQDWDPGWLGHIAAR